MERVWVKFLEKPIDGNGRKSWKLGSGTATGEVNAIASKEAKMIEVAAMTGSIIRKIRVISKFGCNLDIKDIK